MVAIVGNRALDDPGAFGTEHNDALSVRDLGWHLVWVDSAQERLDTNLIAYRFAEDKRMMTPVAISLRRRVPDPLAVIGEGSDAGAGRSVPASL